MFEESLAPVVFNMKIFLKACIKHSIFLGIFYCFQSNRNCKKNKKLSSILFLFLLYVLFIEKPIWKYLQFKKLNLKTKVKKNVSTKKYLKLHKHETCMLIV